MYKIHYPKIENMGDLLNKDMLEELFGIEVRATTPTKSNMSAIGSGLGGTLFSLDKKTKLKQLMYKLFMEKTHYIWGTGFLSYTKIPDQQFIYKSVNIRSLRGKLTQNRIEKILNRKINVPLGDGGLLAERWVGPVEKKFQIGIIPHFKEQNHPLIAKIKEYYGESCKVIDLKDDPKKVIRDIGECEVILSSSLHGLIVADSYHIPNRHILFYAYGEKAMGDGYKFADYYSAFGLEDRSINILEDGFPSIGDIVKNYQVPKEMVEQKKDDIFKAFPIF